MNGDSYIALGTVMIAAGVLIAVAVPAIAYVIYKNKNRS